MHGTELHMKYLNFSIFIPNDNSGRGFGGPAETIENDAVFDRFGAVFDRFGAVFDRLGAVIDWKTAPKRSI